MKHIQDRIRSMVARSGSWYEVRAAADVATIRIYDEISYFGVTADDFARDLEAISAPRIEVQINSPGGNVFDGLAIYNALRLHPAHVTTRVDGLAASAASVIAQAGDDRIMVSSSQMMIHEAWGGCVGNASDMLEMATVLEQQNDVLAAAYAERSGGDAAEFRALMAAETWYTADAAVTAGLADEVLTPERRDAPGNKIDAAPAAAGDRFDPALSLALLD